MTDLRPVLLWVLENGVALVDGSLRWAGDEGYDLTWADVPHDLLPLLQDTLGITVPGPLHGPPTPPDLAERIYQERLAARRNDPTLTPLTRLMDEMMDAYRTEIKEMLSRPWWGVNA